MQNDRPILPIHALIKFFKGEQRRGSVTDIVNTVHPHAPQTARDGTYWLQFLPENSEARQARVANQSGIGISTSSLPMQQFVTVLKSASQKLRLEENEQGSYVLTVSAALTPEEVQQLLMVASYMCYTEVKWEVEVDPATKQAFALFTVSNPADILQLISPESRNTLLPLLPQLPIQQLEYNYPETLSEIDFAQWQRMPTLKTLSFGRSAYVADDVMIALIQLPLQELALVINAKTNIECLVSALTSSTIPKLSLCRLTHDWDAEKNEWVKPVDPTVNINKLLLFCTTPESPIRQLDVSALKLPDNQALGLITGIVQQGQVTHLHVGSACTITEAAKLILPTAIKTNFTLQVCEITGITEDEKIQHALRRNQALAEIRRIITEGQQQGLLASDRECIPRLMTKARYHDGQAWGVNRVSFAATPAATQAELDKFENLAVSLTAQAANCKDRKRPSVWGSVFNMFGGTTQDPALGGSQQPPTPTDGHRPK